MEAGGVFPGYNDLRIPGKGAPYSPGTRNTLSVLVAPRTVKASGTIPTAVQFQDKTFGANTPLDAGWKFNSHRLTYRYGFARSEEIEFGLGLTARIRDAKIRLSGGGTSSTKTDLGFVPLINVRLLWNASSTVEFLVEGDALGAPQGRAGVRCCKREEPSTIPYWHGVEKGALPGSHREE